ncbi:hypothetical protein [Salinigranum sp. GCM10025319]|uniref:hypothetical protein n=1 Tax=Salinigranum sp. GCM10025319 TaxID=3252687 RepID=UPI00362093E2
MVEEIHQMLHQLDTESVEVHEIEQQGTPPEEAESLDTTEVVSGPTDEAETEDMNKSPAERDPESGVEADSAPKQYQPHQYIIQAETPVGPDYVVRAVEGSAYFDVIADYSLVHDVAEFYDEDGLEAVSIADLEDDHPLFMELPQEILARAEAEGEEEMIARLCTGIEALDNLNEEIKGEIIYQLTEIFTTAPVKYVVESTRQNGKGGIKGFEVFYRIFPYEDGFGLKDLNEVVERVRMATQRGKIFLKYSFQLDVDFGAETGGSSIQANPPKQSTRWGNPLNNVTKGSLHRPESEID